MKHAYLIMAHHRFDVLELLLQDLDDPRNDIFLHIDRKTGTVDEERLRACVKSGKLHFVRRLPVYWGDISQIRCVLSLLKQAAARDHYDYYHLLVGVEFPLKSQDYIHRFFEENAGKEFIGYDNEHNYSDRIRYYHFFNKWARSTNKIKKYIYQRLGNKLLRIQRALKINRLKHDESWYKKGYANWSITDKCARYVLSKKQEIIKACRFSHCADELFLHTLVFHSDFYLNVYDTMDEYHSVMRITTWENKNNQFHIEDIPTLVSSDYLFARKFDGQDATQCISEIKRTRAY